jgi:hypothetical protein
MYWLSTKYRHHQPLTVPRAAQHEGVVRAMRLASLIAIPGKLLFPFIKLLVILQLRNHLDMSLHVIRIIPPNY